VVQPVLYGDNPFRVPEDNPLIQGVDPSGLTRFMNLDVFGNLLVGTGPNITLDTNNSTSTPLNVGGSFTGTATDLTNYAEVIIQFIATPASAQASLFFEFSPDGTNWDVSVPSVIFDPTFFIPYPLIPVARYFRVRYLNDSGTAAGQTGGTSANQTVFRFNTYLFRQPTKEIARTLAQPITDNQPVSLGRDVIMGKTTDGTYINLRADGIITGDSSTTPLTAGQTFTGSWFDAAGYASFACIVRSDQTSNSSGWLIQFSNDAGATVVSTKTFSYASDDTGLGIRQAGPMDARYIRVVYQNGGINQGNFFLQTSASTVPAQSPQAAFDTTFTDAQSAVVGRDVIAAKNPSGVYGNIGRNSAGGLITAVLALSAASSSQGTTSGSAGTVSQILTPALTNRKSVSIKCLSGNANTDLIGIGFVNTITTANSYQLNPGDSVDLDIDDTVSIFLVSNHSSVGWAAIEVGGN
jgi:hypothetical protein